jgi:hypothetical protein
MDDDLLREFELVLVRVHSELIESGVLDASDELMRRLVTSSTSASEQQDDLVGYMIVHCKANTHDAVRAAAIHRELEILTSKGCSVNDAIRELVQRISTTTTTTKEKEKEKPSSILVQKKIKEFATVKKDSRLRRGEDAGRLVKKAKKETHNKRQVQS